MKTCPFCAEQIQDEAIKCRYCGEFLDDRPRGVAGYRGVYWSYEYRSQAQFLGWPLLHIAQGINPRTGLPYVARGIIAIGNIAVGALAIGGIALGGLTLGGVGLGLLVIGGFAIGGVAFGGVALAVYLAVGGLAASLFYAIGGIALAPHAIGGASADPALLRLLGRWWPSLKGISGQ